MERPLLIFEMHEGADPTALAQSQLVPGLFPWEYAVTRAQRAIDLQPSWNDDATLWAFAMLPVGPLVSELPLPSVLLVREASSCLEILPIRLQIRAVNAMRSDPPTPRSRAHARVAQRREQERVARRRERNMRRREHRERRSEEYQLREQQGLSSPGTEEYSSSDEGEEESDGGRPPREVAALAPLAQSWGGGGGDGAWCGRRSARRRATSKRGDACHGDSGARRGDGRGRGGGNGVRRAPEEKEEGIFHPMVSGHFPSSAFSDWSWPKFLVLVFAGWRPPCPLLRRPRC
jgi:hypothetical protein